MIQPWITTLRQSTESQIVSSFKIGLGCRQGAACNVKYWNWQMVLFPWTGPTTAWRGQEGVAFEAYGTGAIANMQNDPTAELMLHVFCWSESRGFRYVGKHSLHFCNKVHGKCRAHKTSFVLGSICFIWQEKSSGSWCRNICLYWEELHAFWLSTWETALSKNNIQKSPVVGKDVTRARV